MATVNAITYMKNVGRSLGYTAIDVLKSYNPTVVAAADNAKSYTTDLYHAVKDFNASLKEKKDANESTLMGDVKDTLKDTWNNTKADLLSGNLYNKQRIKAGEEEMMKSMFGDLDFNFDDDFGDFDFDDDLEDASEDKIVSAEMESAKAIVTGADMIGAKMSGSINSTTVAVGDHIAKSQERSSKAIYSLTERGFGQISVGLAAVNSNLTVLSTLAEPLNAHMQNSATFYAKSTEYQNKMLEMMEKVVKNTDDGSSKRGGYSNSSTANRITDLITADGVIDLKAYSEMVMKNIRNYTDIAKDMIEMMGGVKNAGKMVSSSPISLMLNFGMKKMMPQLMKDTMENFNKMLADYMPVALDKFRSTSFDNPILSVIKDFIAPETSVKVTYNPGKYEKGKMPWDGVAKRSLTYVIPMHLARIETALTGQASKMYNYETGRWIYPSQVKREHTDMLKRTAKYSSDASYEIDSILRTQQTKGKISEKDKDRMSKEFEDFLVAAMRDGGTDYLNFMKDDFNPNKYNMSRDTYNFVKEVIKYKERNGDYRFRNNMNAGIVRSRDEIINKMRNMEDSGDDTMKILFDNGFFDKNGKERRTNSILTSVTDDYNNNIFFYLQGIYLHAKHVSDNLGNLAVRGRRVQGASIERDGEIKPIGTLTINTNNSTRSNNTSATSAPVFGPNPANDILDNLSDAINEANGEFSTLPPELRDYQRLKEDYKGNDWENDKNYDKDKEDRLKAALAVGKSKAAIKGWLADTAVGRSINKFFETLGKPADIISKRVSGLFDAVSVSLNNKLYGEDNEGGILDYLRDIRNDFRNIFGRIANKLGFELFGTKDANGNFDNGKFFGRMFNETKEGLKNVGSYIKNRFSFAGGGRVTKTGLATLHEGEYVIPNGGSRDALEELIAASRGEIAEGYVGRGSGKKKNRSKKRKDRNAKKQQAAQKPTPTIEEEIADIIEEDIIDPNSPLGKTMNFVKDSFTALGKGVFTTAKEILGDPSKDKQKIDEFMGDLKGKFTKIFGEEGEGGLGGMGAGAVVGGGLSILTGCMINPILGAGIGAAVGLVKKSETVQELLFGNENNRTDLQKAMAKFFTDNLPDTALGAGIGGLAGTMFMGSPLLGTILGAGLGFAASSDKVKNYLFGEGDLDNGLIRKDTQEKIKKALPNIGAGAIAGLIAGPFGIVGNLILGSTLGYITSTEKFKEWFFGVEDDNGNRVGGVTQVLRENIKEVRKDIVKPLLGIFDKLVEEFRQGFRDMVYNIRSIISKAASGLITHLKTYGIFSDIMNSVPMQSMMNLGKAIIRKPEQIVSGALKGINNRLSKRALLRGYRVKDEEGNVLDAAGRMALAENLPKFSKGEYAESDWGKIDVNIGNMSLEQITATQGAIEDIKKNRDEAALRNRQTAERIRLHDEILHYIKLPKGDARAILGNIDRMIEGGIESGDFTQLMNWLDSTELIDDSAKIRVATAIAKTETATAQLRERIAQFKLLKEKMGKGFNIDRYSERLATEATSREAEKASMDEAEEKSKREKIFESITKNIPDSINDMVYLLSFIADPNRAAIETSRIDEIRKKREGTFKNFNAVGGRKNIADSSASSAAELLDDLYHENDEVTKEGATKEDGGKTLIYHNGEWIDKKEYEKDKELKDALIGNLPFLSGIKGFFGKIGDFLGIGRDENGEKKKGPLQRLVEGLFGDGSEGNPGILGGIFGLLTGKLPVGGTGVGAIIKNLYSSVGGVAGVATTLGIGGLIFAGFSGMLNDIMSKIPGMGGGDNSSGGNTYGETATTVDGTEVHKDEHGNLVDANGNIHSASEINIGSIQSQRVDTASFSERLWGSTIRGALTGTPSLGGLGLKLATKPGTLGGWAMDKLGSSMGKIGVSASKLFGKAIPDACLEMGLKLAPTLAKFGIPVSTTENMFFDLAHTLEKYTDKIGKSLIKGGGKEVFEDVLKVAEIVWIVVDFMSGYEDARTTLGIIDEPTVGQRILSGLLRAVKNIIPIVGPMIPDSLVIDVFAKWLAPALGIDISELTDSRNRAQEALAAYNEATGSNITDVGEFNKKVLKDYSLTERVGNIFVNDFNKAKTLASRISTNVQEKGIGGAIESEINIMGQTFMQGFNSETDIVLGMMAGIAEVMKATPFGSSGANIQKIIASSLKGDIAGLWTTSFDEFKGGDEDIEGTDLKTAVPGIFSKLFSIVDNYQFKLTLTPVTLAIMAGNALKAKIGEMISPIVDKVKEHTNLDTLKSMWDATLKGDVTALTKAGDTFNGPNEGFMGTTMTVVNAIPKVLLVPLTMQIGNARAIADKLKSAIDKGKAIVSDFVQVQAPIAKAAFSGDIFGVLQGGREAVDPDDPFTPIQNIASITTRGLYMPIAVMSLAGKTAYERISKIIDFGKLVFGQLGQVTKYSVDATLAGDVDALLTPPTTGEDENGDEVIFSRYQRIVGAGLNFLLTPIAVGIHSGKTLWNDYLHPTMEATKASITIIKDFMTNKFEFAKTGDLDGLWTPMQVEEGTPIDGFAHAANIGANVLLTLPTLVVSMGSKLSEIFSKKKDAFSDDYALYDQFTTSLADIAVKGDITDIWDAQDTASYSEDDPIHGLWPVFGFFSKITLILAKLFESVIDKAGPVIDFVSDKLNTARETLDNAGDTAETVWDYTKETAANALDSWRPDWTRKSYWFDQGTTEGEGSRLAGKGFVSQTDPRYAGMRMGNGESVAEAGCAPAVASMVSQYYGKPMSMQQAINRSSAFQTPDGTTIDYFGNALSGGSTINTAPIGDTNGVMSNLASGNPVIMLGQDGRNTSKFNSPFGPGSHYVLGTGLDRSGNIIVNDPEQNGPRSYSPAILGSLRSAIGTSGGSSRMKNMKITPIKVRLSAGRGSVQSRKPEIWSWLHSKAGFNDVQAAAIMGCWEAESGNSPKRIECDYLYNYDIDWDGVATDEGLDYYCVNKVFPKYKPGKINKEGYKHNGHYYPGLGLAGWTGGRCRDLVMFAKSKGRAWYDLETQLDFFMGEMTNKYSGLYNSLKACNNLADATELFATKFEHGAFKKGTSHYNDRYRNAQTIYAQFTGQPFVDINGYDSASGGSMKVSAIDKLLQIAMAEEGYTEHNSEAHVQEMGGNGHDNWNKYGYLTGAPHDMWCASYVSWVYDKLVDGDKNKFAALLGGGPSASCATLRNNAMNAGLYTDKPSVGDVVIFGTKGSRPASHTGIVIGVNPDGTYDLINGNASDAVRVAKNRSTNKNVANGKQYPDGFIHPRWNDVFPGMVDSYNASGNSFLGAMASAGASLASSGSSGNVLSDITGVFSTVLSNIFNAGRNQSSDASSTYSDYSGYNNSYSDYSSYYSDYSTLDDYSKDYSGDSSSKYSAGDYHNAYETKVLEGQNNTRWTWANANQKGPKDTAQQHQWDAAKTAYEKALLLAKWNNRTLKGVAGIPSNAQSTMSDQQIIDYYMNNSKAGSGSGLARGRGSRRSNPYIANYATPSGRGSSTRYTYAGRGPESMPANNTTIINPGNMDKTTAMLLKTIITCIETVASNTSSINGIYEVLTEMAKRGGSTEAALAAIEAANANKSTQVDGALESLKATVDAILAS